MTLLQDATKPFNLLTLLLSIVGIVLAFIFYESGIKEKAISYQITEPTSLIFDSKNTSSKIKLLENDSNIITDNVYLLNGAIWNSGDLPIEKSDIRKQISFKIDDANRILDYKITRQKDEEVAKFKIVKSNANTLKIDWDYFDPKFGFTFQVMYTGNENPNFNISGFVLGINEFIELKHSKIVSKDFILRMISVSLSVIFITIFYRSFASKRDINLHYQNFILVGLVMLLISLLFLIYFRMDIPIPF